MGADRGAALLRIVRILRRRLGLARARLGWALHRRERGRPLVVFIGDSITREWLDYVPGMFVGRRRTNAGANGETSLDMLARFERDVIARRPGAVHIMAGTNDLWHGDPGEGAVDAIARIGEMIARAQAAGIVPILAPPPPIAPRAAPLFGRPELFPALREGVARIGCGEGVVFVDYAEVLGDGAGGIRAGLTTDGVHLSRAGYRAMRTLAERAIARALE